MNNDTNNTIENVTPEAQPVESLEPVESLNVEPAAPVTPTVAEPVAPVAPAPVVAEPVAPAAPVTPVTPTVAEPVTPVAPAPVVAEPAAPAAPVTPVTSTVAEPVTPVAPAPVAAEPVAPAAPVTPVTPVTPAVAEPVTPTPTPIATPTPTVTINGENTVETKKDGPKENPDGTITQSGPNKRLIVMLIMIVVLAGIFVWLLMKKNSSDTPTPATPTPTPQTTSSTLLEDVQFSGHACMIANGVSTCNVSIGTYENSVEYALEVANKDLILVLSDYDKYVKVNVYYQTKGSQKTIVDFKVFLKSTNEELSNTMTEAELRDKLKMFNEGEYTETLTLTTIGTTGVGMSDEENYTYTTYSFTDSNNNVYDMDYKNPPSSLKLTEGKKYTVNFEVKKDENYRFYIKSIK